MVIVITKDNKKYIYRSAKDAMIGIGNRIVKAYAFRNGKWFWWV